MHCRKIPNLSVRALKTGRNAYFDCFAANTNEFDVFRQCACFYRAMIKQFDFSVISPFHKSHFWRKSWKRLCIFLLII